MTDLNPGQIVCHAEHGYGVVAHYGSPRGRRLVAQYANEERGQAAVSADLAGWTPVGILPEGHVAVRVDDLDERELQRLGRREEYPNTKTHAQWNAATRVGKAWAAQQKTPQPDEPTEFGAKVRVTTKEGWRPRFLRIDPVDQANGKPWVSLSAEACTWNELCSLGVVTLGWDDEDSST